MNEIEIIKAYSKIRRRVYLRLLVGFLGAVMTGVVWLFVHEHYFEQVGYYFILGFAVIAITASIYVFRIDKEVVCPSCGKSLTCVGGDTGYHVNLNKCPYCEAKLK